MAMRMTGMMSGLDTESIIQELVAARQKKVDVKKKEQTKLNWKQEAWKELNSKLKNLQTKYLSTMRFSDAYSKKTTKVSNSNAVSVITGENAVNGVQTLEVSQLAKTGYLTGGKIKAQDGKELTALSTMKDIMGSNAFPTGDPAVFTVNTKGKSVDISVTEQTTISDILTQLKGAGLNANFDAKNGRFFVSAPNSGEKNDFSLTASNAGGASVLSALGLQTKVGSDKDAGEDYASYQEYVRYAGYYVAGDKAATIAKMRDFIDADIESRKNSYLDQYKSLTASRDAAQKAIDDINDKYNGKSPLLPVDAYDYQAALDAKQAEIDAAKANNAGSAKIEQLQKEAEEIRERMADAQNLKTQSNNLAGYNNQLNDIAKYATITVDADKNYTVTETAALTNEIEDRYYNKAQYSAGVVGADGKVTLQGNATKVSGQDAKIVLNGAEFTNESNNFEINGLTITALDKTTEPVTVTTQQDTDGIYDMIKNFLKEYNEIVNEMDKLYNADRAKGYEPLTDDEKDSMSEKEVEKWETKIKDSILRRDDNLGTVNSALQSIMAGGIEVNGKTMYLYDFGIETLGYFEAGDNEKHAYHIAGDPDDEFTMNKEDQLKSMIANDPDTVISFFSQMGKNLYEKMFDMSKSVDGYRSFGNFYDDKKMKSEYDSYTTKIKEMETKVAEYEDKWYRKFSKMETALAKMQSNMSAVSSLLGG